jgi:integrase
MPKKARELGPLAVKNLTKAGIYAVGGISGLTLQVLPSGGRSWLLRYSVGTRRREMGLGGFPDVTLAGARELARDARLKIKAGLDPIAERKALRSAMSAADGKAMTFKACAEAYIAAHEASWKNPKHRAQWSATLKEYAYPVLGGLLVNDIELAHVLKVLDLDFWKAKTETAKRLRGRIEQVLDWATVRGYRQGDNPARWRGHLDNLLPAPSKVRKVKHHPALPVAKIGAFMRELRKREGISARALEFLILTATRSNEVSGAVWGEIDLDAKLWVIPAERMKADKQHRVPLSSAATKLLASLKPGRPSDLVFPSPNGNQLSDAAIGSVIKRMNDTDKPQWVEQIGDKVRPVVPHGFRSTFRDWAGSMTDHSPYAAEFALAHSIKDKTEASYARDDLLEKRKVLMADWARFCAKSESATVIQLKPKKALALLSRGGRERP